MTYLQLFFAEELQSSLKMAIYDRFSRIQLSILGVSVRPCAWKDKEHDHIEILI
eukprot:UN24613